MIKFGSFGISDIKLGELDIFKAFLGENLVYQKTTPVEYTGFYVEDISGSNNTLSIVKQTADAPTLTIEKSTNGTTWTTMGTTSTTAITATIPANGKLYLRCQTNAWSDGSTTNNTHNISASGNHNVGGNIMSLLYGSNFTGGETSFPNSTALIFSNLFINNTKLVSILDLLFPAMTMTTNCYRQMFYGCTALTTVPRILPATTLATGCYSGLFYGCNHLTTAPVTLPATTLAESCYAYMFKKCTALTTAPELPATTLATQSYYQMFDTCNALNSITCMATNISATDCVSNWVRNVAASGTFYKNPSMSSWGTGASGIPSGWTKKNKYNETNEPFYIENITSSSITVSIKKNNTNANTLTIQKSTDGITWSSMGSTSTTAITATVSANSKLYLRCSTNAWGKLYNSTNVYNTITANGNHNVGGNSMSLLYGSNFTGNETAFPNTSVNRQFTGLFNGNSKVVSAQKLLLPATTMTERCYLFLFYGCSSLTTPPELPATTLAVGCYYQAFMLCSSLTTAPELPATTLAASCYDQMFRGCTPLTTAPELPATILAEKCYNALFMGCSNLTSITCMATNISATNCTNEWVTNVAASGTFYKNPSMSSWGTGVSGIPSGWTVENAS